jgi:hypothetical protein
MSTQQIQQTAATVAAVATMQGFDLFRLSRAKEIVDVNPALIRKLNREKLLPIYWHGRVALVSKSELALAFEESRCVQTPKEQQPARPAAQERTSRAHEESGMKWLHQLGSNWHGSLIKHETLW